MHAHRRGGDRLGDDGRRAPQGIARLPGDGRALDGQRTLLMAGPDLKPWWSHALFYQAYPRSFMDSDGDGVGDLDGVTAKLNYLEALGVDAIWLNPVMVSPMADNGYDVADPRDVDPLFGGIEALDRLVDGAHRLGMR